MLQHSHRNCDAPLWLWECSQGGLWQNSGHFLPHSLTDGSRLKESGALCTQPNSLCSMERQATAAAQWPLSSQSVLSTSGCVEYQWNSWRDILTQVYCCCQIVEVVTGSFIILELWVCQLQYVLPSFHRLTRPWGKKALLVPLSSLSYLSYENRAETPVSILHWECVLEALDIPTVVTFIWQAAVTHFVCLLLCPLALFFWRHIPLCTL